MSTASDTSDHAGVTGETLLTAEFDPAISKYGTLTVVLIMAVTIVGIPFIPFGLLFCAWYWPKYMARVSARLTTQAVEISKGVFFRTEATIPLDRITDVRLHDGPLMRYCNIRGLRLETAGQSGPQSGSEGNLVGVVGTDEMRDAILRQRQRVLDAEAPAPTQAASPAPAAAAGDASVLVEIRDILARIETRIHAD